MPGPSGSAGAGGHPRDPLPGAGGEEDVGGGPASRTRRSTNKRSRGGGSARGKSPAAVAGGSEERVGEPFEEIEQLAGFWQCHECESGGEGSSAAATQLLLLLLMQSRHAGKGPRLHWTSPPPPPARHLCQQGPHSGSLPDVRQPAAAHATEPMSGAAGAPRWRPFGVAPSQAATASTWRPHR